MLMPAVNSARESARQATCQNNLHEFGVGFTSNANRLKQYCSGAFDWQRDGSVTDVGWVADLVNAGIPVGKMLCPSNPSQISDTYNDLLLSPQPCVAGSAPNTGTWYGNAYPACVANPQGSSPLSQPDGSWKYNPCWAILNSTYTGDLRTYVEANVFKKFFNTNYTASWFLVRTGLILDATGNPSNPSGCSAYVTSSGNAYSSANSPKSTGGVGYTYARACTLGPLSSSALDSSPAQSSTVPLLACGRTVGTLSMLIGTNTAGSPTTMTFTPGPSYWTSGAANLMTSGPGTGYTQGGAAPSGGGSNTTSWWTWWNNNNPNFTVLQDYRGFNPVHRYQCNILFADGSVRAVTDLNKDGFLNDGFSNIGGFEDPVVEVDSSEVYSAYSLRP
jgi:prepilin-type processing-associated H-X9-DG protein